MFFNKFKKIKNEDFNETIENKNIVIEISICTGEKLIGFKNKTTGKLEKEIIVKNME